MAIYFYRLYNSSTSSQQRYYYNTATRTAYTDVVGGSFIAGSTLQSSQNTVIDVYQKGPSTVAIVTYNNTFNSGNNTTYPRLYLNETIVAGTSGDTNNVLLYRKCNSSASPPTLEFGVYSLITKEVTIFFLPLPYDLNGNSICIPFALDTSTIIQQQCIGTTLRRVYYNGTNGVNIVDTPNSTICGYVAPVPDVVVTEVKRVRIIRNCDINPIFLVWKNSLGGWDQWLFHHNQTQNKATEDLGEFVQPIYDLESAEGTFESLGKNITDSMILGASNLTKNQKDVISEILESPKVYMVQKDKSKQVVNIKPGTFSFETKDRLHTVEFEIILPQKYTMKR
jgi:hypothetical protein